MKGPLAHSRAQRRGAAPRGVAALEMALILPLLITIVFGCVDFGRFAYTYIAVTNGAREGANYASTFRAPVHDDWATTIKEQVLMEMGSAFDAEDLTVAEPVYFTEQPSGFRRVQVEVSYPFHTIVNWPLLPNEFTLRRSVQMRVMY